jgi:hypothetical protein
MLQRMDGPLIVHMILFVVVPLLWAYRQYFERMGPEAPELRAYCAQRPLLAALRVKVGDEAPAAATLRKRLGRRSLLRVTLGNWPWTHQVVKVAVSAERGVVRIHALDCRTQRTKEAPPPALTELLHPLLRGQCSRQVWLFPAAYGDVTDRVLGPAGWRLLPDSPARFPLEPWTSAPKWLAAAAAPQRTMRGGCGRKQPMFVSMRKFEAEV